MATERLAPDAILASTGLSGTVSDIQDDPDSPDGNWLTNTSSNANNDLRVSFPTPTPALDSGSVQEFRVLIRKTSNSNSAGWSLQLWENGSQVGSALNSGTLSNTTAVVVSGSWNKTSLSDQTGANVELRLQQTSGGSGGAAGNRAWIEVGAVEWNTQYTAPSGPTITAHPSNQTVTEGQSASFTVSATGSGTLLYQWQEDTGSWGNLSGETSSTLSFTPAALSDNGRVFRCVVTDDFGSENSTSATLTVNPLPVITSHPEPATVVEGGEASFSVSATGTGTLSYQWRKDSSNIGGATSSTYNIDPVALSDAGDYDCVVADDYGSVASNAATLTVTEALTPGFYVRTATELERVAPAFVRGASGQRRVIAVWARTATENESVPILK